MKIDYETTTEYFHDVDKAVITDVRALVNGKKDLSIFENYTQVFDDKYGFINNLSALDLLFNEGKYAAEYLKTQKLIIK
jgi:hypothetical protein